jgi:hypothetical protein
LRLYTKGRSAASRSGRSQTTPTSSASLRRAGNSAEALVKLFEKRGFHPLTFDLQFGHYGGELKVTAAGSVADAIVNEWRDVLFVKPNSKLCRERIAASLAAG